MDAVTTLPRMRPFDIRLMPKINNNYFIIKRPRLAGSKYTCTRRRNTSSQPDTARCSSFIRPGTGIDQRESGRRLSFNLPLFLSFVSGFDETNSRIVLRDLRTKEVEKGIIEKIEIKDGEKRGYLERLLTRFVNKQRFHPRCSDFPPLARPKSVGPRKIRPVGAVKRASRRNLRPVYTHKAIIYLILSCNTL